MLAAEIGRVAVVAVEDREALQGADAVVLALGFAVLKGVIGEIADPLTDKFVVVPNNPLGIEMHKAQVVLSGHKRREALTSARARRRV